MDTGNEGKERQRRMKLREQERNGIKETIFGMVRRRREEKGGEFKGVTERK